MLWKWRKWEFWKSIRQWAERRMYAAWMDGGNCSSCCPRCKQWEHLGNNVTTTDNADESVTRTCGACKYQRRAIFTPAGFCPIEQETPNGQG